MTLNNVALVRVTKLVAPGMVARKRGLILNVSSTSGWAPSPLLSVYAGTKSFVHHFSASLGAELASYGVVVSSLNTHFVVSKLSKIRRANLMTPMPRDYVRSVLGHIGQGSGGVGGMPFIANPYPTHALLQYAVESFAPWSIVAGFVRSACDRLRAQLTPQIYTSASASGPCARPSARRSCSSDPSPPLQSTFAARRIATRHRAAAASANMDHAQLRRRGYLRFLACWALTTTRKLSGWALTTGMARTASAIEVGLGIDGTAERPLAAAPDLRIASSLRRRTNSEAQRRPSSSLLLA